MHASIYIPTGRAEELIHVKMESLEIVPRSTAALHPDLLEEAVYSPKADLQDSFLSEIWLDDTLSSMSLMSKAMDHRCSG
jgi:hypothetical protein